MKLTKAEEELIEALRKVNSSQQKNLPGDDGRWTTEIHLWDDGTFQIERRHGRERKVVCDKGELKVYDDVGATA